MTSVALGPPGRASSCGLGLGRHKKGHPTTFGLVLMQMVQLMRKGTFVNQLCTRRQNTRCDIPKVI